MNLVLFSGGGKSINKRIHQEILSFFPSDQKITLSFIPAEGDFAEEDFVEFCRFFSFLKERAKFRLVSIDSVLGSKERKALLKSDGIFLGGGNTYHLLNNLQKNKLMLPLKQFAKKKLLMGLSAGSIVMTPNIMTAAVPSSESDDNTIGLKKLSAMSLVPFEFAPHYYRERKSDEEILDYSKTRSHPIYACSDGQGIVVRNGAIQFIGGVKVFHKGQSYQFN
ncbi:MAG: Type 1 glutamine amidotransferase-like domain-containing protein [Oligoflexia bacterium]|nr:Type 1 glutamine amidotransferase-like domain-containing protein [Oligoflexia bacterium]